MTVNKSGWGCFTVALVIFSALLVILIVMLSSDLDEEGIYTYTMDSQIGQIDINDVIIDSDATLNKIYELTQNPNLKGLIVRINSPGGAVGATQEIYNELLRTKSRGIKVYASLENIAASGGLYIACAADQVYTNPSTLTGSIGVIFNTMNVEELTKWIGIKFKPIKSGKYKDIGSPHRTMSEEEEALMQEVLDDVYDDFLEVVMKKSGLTKDELLEKYAEGRIYTGNTAIESKIADRAGNLYDCIYGLAKDLGIEGEYKVRKIAVRKPFYEDMFSMKSVIDIEKIEKDMGLRNFGLMYLYMP